MPTDTHECIATHCVACCPTARGYSEGYSDAKSLYNLLSFDDKSSRAIGFLLIAVVGIAIGLIISEVKHERAKRMG